MPANETVNNNGIELVEERDNFDRGARLEVQLRPSPSLKTSPAELAQVLDWVSITLDTFSIIGESIRFANCMHAI